MQQLTKIRNAQTKEALKKGLPPPVFADVTTREGMIELWGIMVTPPKLAAGEGPMTDGERLYWEQELRHEMHCHSLILADPLVDVRHNHYHRG
jgi:hypothetical protein